MIKIKLKQVKDYSSIEIKGHSKNSDEPCARVSTAFDVLSTIFFETKLKYKKFSGYSYLRIERGEIEDYIFNRVADCLKSLGDLYSQIKVKEAGDNENNLKK